MSGAQPDWVEPELATLTRERFSDPAWLYERKFDGERCVAYRFGGQVRLMTRNRQEVNSTYPELDEALSAQGADNFVVDGEVVAFVGRRGEGSHQLRTVAAAARGTPAGRRTAPRRAGLLLPVRRHVRRRP